MKVAAGGIIFDRGQSNYRFLPSFTGRPQQLGFFYNQENTGSVSGPFGLFFALRLWWLRADGVPSRHSERRTK